MNSDIMRSVAGPKMQSLVTLICCLSVTLQEKTLSVGDRLLMIEDTSLVGANYDQVM